MDRSLAPQLTTAESRIIEEEEALAASVREALAGLEERDVARQERRRMATLRSELGDASSDDVATIAAEALRVRSTAEIREKIERPDPEEPYFAHMQLETDRGVRDVLLGPCSFIDSARGVTIVDWRAAPIAQVFFHYDEGDDYEQEFPDRTIEGLLRKRRILAFEGGELVHIQGPDMSLRRTEQGEWIRDATSANPTLEGAEGGPLAKRLIGTGLSGRKLPVISSLLDETQYSALTHGVEHPLLILGGAGCGKTTVALHRLAYLVYQQPEVHRAENLVVIVPEEGLVRLTRMLLEELGMEGVAVSTVDDWFVDRGRRRFPELPARLSTSTPASVVRLKRHPAFLARLADVASDAGRASAEELDRLLGTGSQVRELFEAQSDPFPEARLRSALRVFDESRSDVDLEADRGEMEAIFGRLASPILDRERLFGDRALLEAVVAESEGELPESTVERAIRWYRVQQSKTSEDLYGDVAAERRAAVDGRSLDSGTPSEDADSIDVEDFALLLELARLKSGRGLSGKRAEVYTHMVLDEAQELSEVECRILGSAVAAEGCVTVAGDPAQQIGAHSLFRGWDPLMEALGQGRAAPITLETSYRCTRPIIEFGRAVLGPLASDEVPRVTREGAPVSRSRLSTELHATLLIAEALSDLFDREPMAQVAIIARESETAERLHDALSQQLPTRLVLEGRFAFKPGIDVTTVQQVKGLEFDYVVIPDLGREDYPDDSVSRRMLHVASTRAIHQLWVLATGEWSTLIPT